MNIKLTSARWNNLELRPGAQNTCDGLYFPKADSLTSDSDADGYYYLIQQFETSFLVIRYYCFYSLKKDIVTLTTNEAYATFRMAVNYSHCITSDGLGKQVFHESHCNCFYDPYASVEYQIGPFESCIFLDILLKQDYCLYLQYYFPETEAFFSDASHGIAAKLTHQNVKAQAEIWRWQTELQEWCYDEKKNMNDGNIIANKVIKHAIKPFKYTSRETITQLTPQEINKVYRASELIRSADQMLSLKEVSDKVGLSLPRLDSGFKEIFGHPLSKHRFEENMVKVQRFVDCGDCSLDEVAALLGYKDVKKPMADYIHRFGHAPFQKQEKV